MSEKEKFGDESSQHFVQPCSFKGTKAEGFSILLKRVVRAEWRIKKKYKTGFLRLEEWHRSIKSELIFALRVWKCQGGLKTMVEPNNCQLCFDCKKFHAVSGSSVTVWPSQDPSHATALLRVTWWSKRVRIMQEEQEFLLWKAQKGLVEEWSQNEQEEQEFQLWRAGASHCLGVSAALKHWFGKQNKSCFEMPVKNQSGGLLFACRHQKIPVQQGLTCCDVSARSKSPQH